MTDLLQQPIVAVLYSGQMRTAATCNASFMAHVIAANPSLKFQIYAYLTIDDQQSVELASKTVREAFAYDGADIVKVLVVQDAARNTDLRRRLPAIDTVLGGGQARGSLGALNTARMFYSIAAVESLREQAAGARQAALVMRVRPDLCFCSDLSLSSALAHGRNTVTVPWVGKTAAFDQLAVGPPNLMSKYATAFDTTLSDAVTAGGRLYPEVLMKQHLDSQNILLATDVNLQAALARGPATDTGVISFDDPYKKLRLDFAEEASSMPGYSCRSEHFKYISTPIVLTNLSVSTAARPVGHGGRVDYLDRARFFGTHMHVEYRLVFLSSLIVVMVLCVGQKAPHRRAVAGVGLLVACVTLGMYMQAVTEAS
jgi:hypothetical protein